MNECKKNCKFDNFARKVKFERKNKNFAHAQFSQLIIKMLFIYLFKINLKYLSSEL